MGIDLAEIIMMGLTITFGMWAGVVAWIGKGLFRRLDDTVHLLHEHITQAEARLAVIEDRLDI